MAFFDSFFFSLSRREAFKPKAVLVLKKKNSIEFYL